jgi:acyl-[acyl-carrier-protein] desaturase
MAHVSTGYVSDNRQSMLHQLAYVALQELATRVSHRNAGLRSQDPVCERMLARIAVDENLHMVFYRNVLAAAFELEPDAAMQAVCDVVTTFRMPGYGMPGFNRAAVQMAVGEIYNLRIHHDEVMQPMLRYLRAMDMGGLGADGVRAQQELGIHLDELDRQARVFDEKLAARKARNATRGQPQGDES